MLKVHGLISLRCEMHMQNYEIPCWHSFRLQKVYVTSFIFLKAFQQGYMRYFTGRLANEGDISK